VLHTPVFCPQVVAPTSSLFNVQLDTQLLSPSERPMTSLAGVSSCKAFWVTRNVLSLYRPRLAQATPAANRNTQNRLTSPSSQEWEKPPSGSFQVCSCSVVSPYLMTSGKSGSNFRYVDDIFCTTCVPSYVSIFRVVKSQEICLKLVLFPHTELLSATITIRLIFLIMETAGVADSFVYH